MKKIALLAFLLAFLIPSVTHASNLQVRSQSLNHSSLPRNAVRVPFVKIQLSAPNNTESVKTLTLQRTGLSSHEDLGRVWAETDSYRRSDSRRLSNDDVVELSFRTPLQIEPNRPQILTVYANLESEGGNRTIGLQLLNVNNESLVEPQPQPIIEKQRINPVKTSRKSSYDRANFRIQCKNSRCRLVPRNS